VKIARLSDDDLGHLCGLDQLNWGVLSESVICCLIGLRTDLLGEHRRATSFDVRLREDCKGKYVRARGIIGHLTRDCGGNVQKRRVLKQRVDQSVVIMSGMATNLDADASLWSACRDRRDDIAHGRNNCVCYDSNERRLCRLAT
jgi:hypothetical protein